MPIDYETSVPAAGFAALANQSAYEASLRNRQFALQQQYQIGAGGVGGYGHGGYGHGGYGAYDTGIQDAIFQRDALGFQMRHADQQVVASQQSQAFAANAAMNEQQQRYQLQAQLQETELTQQERMRLQRMKNAVGDVMSNPNLSAQEKNDYVTQLKTGINPLEHRNAVQRMAIEKQQKEAMAEQYQALAGLRKQEADVTAKSAADRTSFIPDPAELAKITEDLRSTNPNLPPNVVSQMATSEAIRQGLGSHVFQEGYGKFRVLNGYGADKSAGATGTGGAAGEFTHPSGIKPIDYIKVLEHAHSMVDKRSAEMKDHPTIPGTKVLAHPELQDLTKRDDEVAKYLKGFLASFEEYSKGLQQRQPAGRAGFDPKKAVWRQGQAAAAAAPNNPAQELPGRPEAKPFSLTDAKTQTRDNVLFVGQLERWQDRIASSPLSEDQKMAGAVALDQMKKLYAKYGDPANIEAKAQKDPEAKKDWANWQASDSALDQLKAAVEGNGEQMGGPTSAAGGGDYSDPFLRAKQRRAGAAR